MVTKIITWKDRVIITEDGRDYLCDNNPGVMGGDRMTIAEFHPKGNYRKTLLVECFEDENTRTRTYKPFSSAKDEKKAWKNMGRYHGLYVRGNGNESTIIRYS